MDITCNSCSAKFRIPDEKIPRGRVSAIPCPKCKTRIPLDPTKKSAGSVVADIVSDQSQDFDFAEKPFDFMEEEGLPSNEVYDILASSEGFLWFATDDGLNRFDGYDFKIFRNDPANPNSI